MAEPPNAEQLVNDFVTLVQTRLGQVTNRDRNPELKDFIFLVIMLADLLLLIFLGADAISKLSKIETFQNTIQLFGQGAQFIITSVCIIGASWFKKTFLEIEENLWFRFLGVVGLVILLCITVFRYNELINININVETNSSQDVNLLINKKMQELQSGNYKFPVFLWGNTLVLKDPKGTVEKTINIGFFDVINCNDWFGTEKLFVVPNGKLSLSIVRSQGLESAEIIITKQKTKFDSNFLSDMEEMSEKNAIQIEEESTLKISLNENKSFRKITLPYGSYTFNIEPQFENKEKKEVKLYQATDALQKSDIEVKNNAIEFYEPKLSLKIQVPPKP